MCTCKCTAIATSLTVAKWHRSQPGWDFRRGHDGFGLYCIGCAATYTQYTHNCNVHVGERAIDERMYAKTILATRPDQIRPGKSGLWMRTVVLLPHVRHPLPALSRVPGIFNERARPGHMSQDLSIPSTHKGCIYDSPGRISTRVVEDLPTPPPGPGQLLIRLTHSGVCHSDLAVMLSNWATLPEPTPKDQVGGHEGERRERAGTCVRKRMKKLACANETEAFTMVFFELTMHGTSDVYVGAQRRWVYCPERPRDGRLCSTNRPKSRNKVDLWSLWEMCSVLFWNRQLVSKPSNLGILCTRNLPAVRPESSKLRHAYTGRIGFGCCRANVSGQNGFYFD